MKGYKYIFVDCFDTVLLRNIPAEETKYYLSKKLVDKLQLNVSAEKLYRMFVSAELRLSKINNMPYEFTLAEVLGLIYERNLIYKVGFKCNCDEFVKAGLELYFDVERESIFANNKIISKLEKYKNDNKKIFLVSDFYCGKEFIANLLKKNNIDNLFDEIFVSCDYNKSKKEGSLYEEILKSKNINSSDVIMIGDNVYSDNIVPNKLGIDSIKIKHKKSSLKKEDKKKIYGINLKTQIDKNLKNILNQKCKYNYSNYAFPLYLFIKKLVENLQNNHAKDVYFLSREGLFLKKLFDKYCLKNNIEITSHYFQVSRNSVFNASLKSLKDENFSFIINESNQISINDFLKTLSASEKLITSLKSEIDCNFDKKIANIAENLYFKQLLKNENFINYYEQLRSSQRKGFSEYLNKIGVTKNDKLFIVDVGWKGTMQDCLYKFFDDNKRLEGYYIGYRSQKGDLLERNVKHGLLYSDCPLAPDFKQKVFEYRIMNYEQILRANHGRVAGYTMDGSVVYDENDNDIENYNQFIKELQDEIESKFEKILDVKTENIEDQIVKINVQFLLHTNRNDIEWLLKANNSFFDAFAKVGKTIGTKNKIKEKFRYKLSCLKFYLKWRMNKL